MRKEYKVVILKVINIQPVHLYAYLYKMEKGLILRKIINSKLSLK